MITQSLRFGIRTVATDSRRGFGICVPAAQKAAEKIADPIQQLFLTKLREYKSKQKDGGFVDPTPEIQREYKSELERVAKQFGGEAGTDMTKFPDFKFEEPKLDPINATSAPAKDDKGKK